MRAARRDTGLLKPVADKIVQALPPSKSTPYTLDNLQRAIPYLEQEHQVNPITDPASFRDAADANIKSIEDQVAGHVEGRTGGEPRCRS